MGSLSLNNQGAGGITTEKKKPQKKKNVKEDNFVSEEQIQLQTKHVFGFCTRYNNYNNNYKYSSTA